MNYWFDEDMQIWAPPVRRQPSNESEDEAEEHDDETDTEEV